VSVVWLGLFINLLMVVALVWLVYLVGRLAGHVPDMRIVCWAGLGLAVLISAYGMWNARHPVVTRVTVPVQDLPAQWQGATVVHLSDVHLGTIRGTGYARDVVERVNALEPDLVLITGDLLDGMGGDLEELVKPLDALEAKKGVFFVTGNHEGYLGLVEPLRAVGTTSFRILDNEVVDVDGLQLVGLSFPEHDREGELSIVGTIDQSKPSILMYHTPTEVQESASGRGEQQNRTYFSPDTSFTFVKKHGIDLQLSGHTHEGQFFPFTLVARLIYGPYNYGLHRVGDFHIYTTSGTGTWGPPMRLGSRSEIVALTLGSGTLSATH
jgi:predicted MPP superfamily phosphohydrolase